MARMLPDVDLDTLEHGSERVVYQALRDQLPNAYTVLHSYPWLRPQRSLRGTALREGEADFVVLHRERGVLVLEVKGGHLKLQNHTWHREKAGGWEPIKDPFDQASRNMHALLDSIEERGGPRRQQLIYGTAVVFPHHHYSGPLPPNADKAMIISQRDFADITASIEKAYACWTAKPRPLSQPQYQQLQNALLPTFKLFRPIGPDIELASQQLYELTQDQQAVIQGLFDNSRVLIEGAAGSGKTLIALDRALAFARTGARSLFVCFNVELACWLREQVNQDPLQAPYAQRLDIWNFHALAIYLAKRAGVEFTVPVDPEAEQAFWDLEVPDMLEQAMEILDGYENCRYDAIVVDEAQDFCELWWYTLTQALLKDPEQGALYAFFDSLQSLRETATLPPLDIPTTFRMRINCRNTQRIAKSSAKILNTDSVVLSKSPVGESLQVFFADTLPQRKKLPLSQLHRLLGQERVAPRQIVLLGPSGKAKGSLADVDVVDGISLVTSAEEWRQDKGVLVTTTRSFKGLEADVVILYDVGHLGGLFTKSDLYVACTRARYLLIAVVHDEQTQKLIKEAARELGK